MSAIVVGSDFTDGAQLPLYSDGRILLATDLSTAQATLLARDARVARAVGSGVVDGLWVTAGATTLAVAPGNGLVASGQPLVVGTTVTLPLVVPGTAATTVGAAFSCCASVAGSSATAVDVGAYLLTASPASRPAGRSPTAAAPGGGTGNGCVAQWEVEGVAFSAVALPLPDTVMGVPVTDDNRRTLLAAWCLDAEQRQAAGVDPFGAGPAAGGLAHLAGLTDDELPLAVFHWNGQAISFVDTWSARRDVTAPTSATGRWEALVAPRRVSEGRARYLQFEDQLDAVLAAGTAGGTVATTTFPVLPPVGLLPVTSDILGLLFDRAGQDTQFLPQFRDRVADPTIADAGKIDAAKDDAGKADAADDDAVRRLRVRRALENARLLIATADDEQDAAPAPAFDVRTFFGSCADYGGILDWDVVTVALLRSTDIAAGVPVPRSDEERKDGAAPSYLLYLVVQNLRARAEAQQAGTTVPALYVVFVRTTWWRDVTLPFLDGAGRSRT